MRPFPLVCLLLATFPPGPSPAQVPPELQERVRPELQQVAPEIQRPSPRDTRLWERLDTGAVSSRVAGTVAVPPDSLRVARSVLRNGAVRLEAPLASITTGGRTLDLELSIDAAPGLSCTRRECSGIVQVEVLASDRPNSVLPLPVPLSVDLYGVESVRPVRLTLTSTRRLHAVEVRSRTGDATLTAHPDGLPSIEVPLPLRTLALRMSAESEAMDAWGLETIALNIAPVEGLDPSDTVDIQLQGSGVRVDPSLVRLTAATGATARLRSRGLGTGGVTALGPAYIQEAHVPIRLAPPWLFFGLALLGGLIGGFAREKLRDRAGEKGGAGTRIAAVALIALVLATGTALGLNVTGLPLPAGVVSEMLGFVEAGIIAFLIDPVLDRLGGGSGGTGPPAPREPARERQPA